MSDHDLDKNSSLDNLDQLSKIIKAFSSLLNDEDFQKSPVFPVLKARHINDVVEHLDYVDKTTSMKSKLEESVLTDTILYSSPSDLVKKMKPPKKKVLKKKKLDEPSASTVIPEDLDENTDEVSSTEIEPIKPVKLSKKEIKEREKVLLDNLIYSNPTLLKKTKKKKEVQKAIDEPEQDESAKPKKKSATNSKLGKGENIRRKKDTDISEVNSEDLVKPAEDEPKEDIDNSDVHERELGGDEPKPTSKKMKKVKVITNTKKKDGTIEKSFRYEMRPVDDSSGVTNKKVTVSKKKNINKLEGRSTGEVRHNSTSADVESMENKKAEANEEANEKANEKAKAQKKQASSSILEPEHNIETEQSVSDKKVSKKDYFRVSFGEHFKYIMGKDGKLYDMMLNLVGKVEDGNVIVNDNIIYKLDAKVLERSDDGSIVDAEGRSYKTVGYGNCFTN